jgi:hypothetical protein
MKFNWGHGIFLFLVIFLLSVAFVVYKGFQEKNALVEEEYYPKGLEYQKQIDRIARADSLPEKIKMVRQGTNIEFTYPASFFGTKVEGSIYFYRPSDDAGDYREKMLCDSSLTQKVPVGKLMPGKYIVKLNWTASGKEYYHEEVLLVE